MLDLPRRIAGRWLPIAWLMIAGCGEVPAPETGSDAAVDPCSQPELGVDEFFACFSERFCAILEDCAGWETSHFDCRELPFEWFGDLPATQLQQAVESAIASERGQWDAGAARQCLDLFPAANCAAVKDNDLFAACRPLVGAIQDFQPCASDLECATAGALCLGDDLDHCVGHTCRPPQPTDAWCGTGSTDGFDRFCGPGDHCVERGGGSEPDTSLCTTGEPGQICYDDSDCDLDLFCNGADRGASSEGTCTVARAVGSACLTDRECTGETMCVGNLLGAGGHCVDVRAAGAMCDLNPDNGVTCEGFQHCDAIDSNSIGQCQAAPEIGEPCGFANNEWTYCGQFALCEEGTCRAPGELGDECEISGFGISDPLGCNPGLWCTKTLNPALTMGTCKAPRANGETCTSDDPGDRGSAHICASDWCEAGVCADYPACTL